MIGAVKTKFRGYISNPWLLYAPCRERNIDTQFLQSWCLSSIQLSSPFQERSHWTKLGGTFLVWILWSYQKHTSLMRALRKEKFITSTSGIRIVTCIAKAHTPQLQAIPTSVTNAHFRAPQSSMGEKICKEILTFKYYQLKRHRQKPSRVRSYLFQE